MKNNKYFHPLCVDSKTFAGFQVPKKRKEPRHTSGLFANTHRRPFNQLCQFRPPHSKKNPNPNHHQPLFF